MQHILVVADQTLRDEPLVTVVRHRLDAGPSDMHRSLAHGLERLRASSPAAA